MKSLFFLFGFLMVSMFSFSQKTVEVTATDTVNVKIESFKYSIILSNIPGDLGSPMAHGSYYTDMALKFISEEDFNDLIEKCEGIKEIPIEKGFDVYPNEGYGIVQKLYEVEELNDIKELRDSIFLYSNIVAILVPSFPEAKEEDEKRLIDKLLTQAKNRAGLYLNSGEKIGGIIEIKEFEDKNSTTYSWNLEDMIHGNSGRYFGGNIFGLKYSNGTFPIVKSISVKFSVE